LQMKQVKDYKQAFHECLKRMGLRSTVQRDVIVDEFFAQDRHLTPEELYRILRRKHRRIGFSTVYRTLKLLTGCSLVREVGTSNGTTLFEASFNHPHHDHLICDCCGKLIEFLDQEIESIQERVALKHQFHMTGHRLIIQGICRECIKKGKS